MFKYSQIPTRIKMPLSKLISQSDLDQQQLILASIQEKIQERKMLDEKAGWTDFTEVIKIYCRHHM